jgi:hypothetical protein
MLVVVVVAATLLSAGARDVGATAFSPDVTISLSDSSPGANSAITTGYLLESPEAMAEALVTFIPAGFGVSSGESVTDGALVGRMNMAMTLGLVGSACNQQTEAGWDLTDASTDTTDTVSYQDIDDDGVRDFAEDEDGDGLADSVTRYPEPLTRIFPGLTPLARMHGLLPIAGLPFMVNILVFEPGTDLYGEAIDPALGYPAAVIFLDTGDPAPDPEPGAFTDWCTPSHVAFETLGVTGDNPMTAATEGGEVYRTNPSMAGTYHFGTMAISLPDADGDGIENQLDTCAQTTNFGSPRVNYSGDADGDGLDAACDPNSDPSGGTNDDQDSDGYRNRQDNCPLVQNGMLDLMNQVDSDLDGIGDSCDIDPLTVQGHRHVVCVVSPVEVGNGGATLPAPVLPCDTDDDGYLDALDNCPTVPNAGGQADDIDGDMAGDACDAPGSGNVDCSGPLVGVSSVDALKVLRFGAGLSVTQNEPCLDIGLPRALVPPDDWKLGDTNCSGLVNSVDALLILRANAGLSVNIPAECPEVKPA